jgi:hypothetical protein
MSYHRPYYVQQLCRQLGPWIQTQEARAELKALCKIKHRSQFNRWFPRNGVLPNTVRMTARVALKAQRWLAENQGIYYVPSAAMVLVMARELIKARRLNFVSILANNVGGGLTKDQIYSYVSMRRREPDGEFALRFIRLVARLRGIAQNERLGGELQRHPDWVAISTSKKALANCGRRFSVLVSFFRLYCLAFNAISRYRSPSSEWRKNRAMFNFCYDLKPK